MTTHPKHRFITVQGVRLFYREAGPDKAPTVLLLHGFPSSSIQYRYLMVELSDRYHVIAPDLPGFGLTQTVDSGYVYTFNNLAKTIEGFIVSLELDIAAIYLHDYGAQVGFRLLTDGRVQPRAIIVQNTESYHGIGWRDMMWGLERRLTENPDVAKHRLVTSLLNPDGIQKEFTEALAPESAERIDPDIIALGYQKLKEEGAIDAMVDLHMDYGSNFAQYAKTQEFLRRYASPLLVLFGVNDQYLTPAAAEAYRGDAPNANVQLLDGGHWLLESHIAEVNHAVRKFLDSALYSD